MQEKLENFYLIFRYYFSTREFKWSEISCETVFWIKNHMLLHKIFGPTVYSFELQCIHMRRLFAACKTIKKIDWSFKLHRMMRSNYTVKKLANKKLKPMSFFREMIVRKFTTKQTTKITFYYHYRPKMVIFSLRFHFDQLE